MKEKTLFIIIILIFSSIFISGCIGPDNKKDSEDDDLFLLIEGTKNNLYVDEEKFENHLDPSFNYFTLLQNESSYQISEKETIARAFLINPIIDDNETDTFQSYYRSKDHDDFLIISSINTIRYYNDDQSLIPLENKISNTELIEMANEIILNYRGKIDDLLMDNISTTFVYKADSESGEKEVLGYEYQRITFQQYYNNIPIVGSKGKISIEFGLDGKLEYLKDTTVVWSEEFVFTHIVPSLYETLDEIGDITLTRSGGDFYVKDWRISLYTDEKLNFQELDIKWELFISSISTGESMMYYR